MCKRTTKMSMKSLITVIILLISLSAFSDLRKYPTDTELQNIFSKIEPEFTGVEGYRYTADTYFHGNMFETFQYTSRVKGIHFIKSLHWGNQYIGSTSEQLIERSRIFSKEGFIIEKYQGKAGYINYANDYYTTDDSDAGDMQKAYQNVSSVLTKQEMDELGWNKAYHGTTLKYQSEKENLINENGSFKEKYHNRAGYVLFADDFYEGNMKKAFMNVAAILSKDEFKNLNWGKSYNGTTTRHNNERLRILNSDGTIKHEYRGQKGYVNYSKKYYDEDMLKAYINISSVLTPAEMHEADWGNSYHGKVEICLKERSKIIDQKGNVFNKYLGQLGLRNFAINFYDGNMFKAYLNISSILQKEDKVKLGWFPFPGHVEEFDAIREFLKNRMAEIDTTTYFGRKEGLNLAIENYIIKNSMTLPIGQDNVKKVREKLRYALTKEERVLIGWDNDLLTNTKTLLPSKRHSLSKEIKLNNPKRSVKRASRK